MDEYTFPKLIEEVLQKVEVPLSSREIWDYAGKFGITKKLNLNRGKTPWETISRYLYVDIRDNEKSIYYQPSKRPAKFALKKFKKEIVNKTFSQEVERTSPPPEEEKEKKIS